MDYVGHQDQLFGHTTYAQHGDDIVLRCFFDSIGIDKPSYVDIGAHHPLNISNTALFYTTGSRGVNIEPNPSLFVEFLKQRPEDINLNIGIADKSGFLDFYMIDEYSGRNTFDANAAQQFCLDFPEFSISSVRQIPVKTLDEVLPFTPDFLTLDAEGLDLQILKSINFSKHSFKAICVEWSSANGSILSDLKSLLETKGYVTLMKCGGNIIFIKKEYELLAR